MNFLAIETSCDESAAAVFTDELVVLSSVVASQTDLHARFGGVVPEIASRAHLRNLLPVIDEALANAGVSLQEIGCIAVHNTPGLVGALLVGVSAAKMFALALGVPLIAVNHVQSHIFACRMAAGRDIFPCAALVVSGGHTALFRCDTALSMSLLGGTRDDAAGEAFDKVAAILGLGFPGGPAVEREAVAGNLRAIEGSQRPARPIRRGSELYDRRYKTDWNLKPAGSYPYRCGPRWPAPLEMRCVDSRFAACGRSSPSRP